MKFKGSILWCVGLSHGDSKSWQILWSCDSTCEGPLLGSMQVYKGWWIGVHEVAIKVFTEVNSGGESLLVARKALLREVALLKSCRSPFIVQVRSSSLTLELGAWPR